MLVHADVIVADRVKEVDMVLDIGKDLNPGLDHGGDGLEVIVPLDIGLEIGKGHPVELLEGKRLDVLSVHPL